MLHVLPLHVLTRVLCDAGDGIRCALLRSAGNHASTLRILLELRGGPFRAFSDIVVLSEACKNGFEDAARLLVDWAGWTGWTAVCLELCSDAIAAAATSRPRILRIVLPLLGNDAVKHCADAIRSGYADSARMLLGHMGGPTRTNLCALARKLGSNAHMLRTILRRASEGKRSWLSTELRVASLCAYGAIWALASEACSRRN
jgi:hypothetical protein